MSKSSKKKAANAVRGTWALCITAGLMLGLGMAPIIGSLPIGLLTGILGGTLAGYLFTSKRPKH